MASAGTSAYGPRRNRWPGTAGAGAQRPTSPHQANQCVAPRGQPLAQLAADQPGRAGHQSAHASASGGEIKGCEPERSGLPHAAKADVDHGRVAGLALQVTGRICASPYHHEPPRVRPLAFGVAAARLVHPFPRVAAISCSPFTPADVAETRAWPSPRMRRAPWLTARCRAAGPQSSRHCAPWGARPSDRDRSCAHERRWWGLAQLENTPRAATRHRSAGGRPPSDRRPPPRHKSRGRRVRRHAPVHCRQTACARSSPASGPAGLEHLAHRRCARRASPCP